MRNEWEKSPAPVLASRPAPVAVGETAWVGGSGGCFAGCRRGGLGIGRWRDLHDLVASGFFKGPGHWRTGFCKPLRQSLRLVQWNALAQLFMGCHIPVDGMLPYHSLRRGDFGYRRTESLSGATWVRNGLDNAIANGIMPSGTKWG